MAFSGPNTDVRVDVFAASLREVQHERLRLEKKLNETRNERLKKEEEVAMLEAKLNHSREHNSKLKGTLRMAFHKVSYSQASIDALQKRCNPAIQENESLQNEIETHKSERMELIKDFENEINCLIGRFQRDRSYYENDNLKKEAEKSNKKKGELFDSTEVGLKMTRELCRGFEDMKLEAAKFEEQKKGLEFDPATQQQLMEGATHSRNELQENVRNLSLTLDEVTTERRQLEDKKALM